jgi:hypothetical protein
MFSFISLKRLICSSTLNLKFVRKSVTFMASKNNNPKGRENDIVVQQLKDEVLIYDLTTNKAFCLNETSAAIWNLCDGNSSVSDITKQVSKQLKSPVTEDFVWLALDGLKKENLIENETQFSTLFEGLSRREAIRKVGLGSMIALPMISSLIAPTAAHAQSAGAALAANGATCTANADCNSTCCASNTCTAAGTVPRNGACTATCQCELSGDTCVSGVCQGRFVVT